MCGIAGIVSLGPRRVEVRDLERMAAPMVHRGPDENGYVLLDDGGVGLAHLRLSIIDLGTGQQPLFNEDGSVAVSFNGEIYDHQAHRRDLEEKGHRFRTTSDTEVLVHLYEEYGVSFLDRIDGEFAFLLWDGRSRTLLAARDRSGVKPLFYRHEGGEVLFASEMKGILALPRVGASFNPEYLWTLSLGLYAPGQTLFAGLQSLKPAHYLVIRGSEVGPETPFWRQDYHSRPMSFSEAREEVLPLLRRAVSRRLVADVPVGLYLSSGLDSSLIAALMAEQGGQIDAYHLSFGRGDYDESPLAARIAGHFGLPFHEVVVGYDDLVEALIPTLWHTEMPIWNLHSAAKGLLSRFVNRCGGKVCLTGEGADEGFAGYPFFKMEALQRQPHPGLFEQFARTERTSEGILWSAWDSWKQQPGGPSHHLTRAWSNAALARKIFSRDLVRSQSLDPTQLFQSMLAPELNPDGNPVNRSRQLSREVMHHYIIPTLGDRMEMASSVECRTPFLDREVLEFSGRIPPEHLLDLPRLKDKWVLREAAADILPDFLKDETKKPFLSPDWHTLANSPQGSPLFQDFLSEQALDKAGVFHSSYVRLLFDLWRTSASGRNRNLDLLMGMVLSVQILSDLYTSAAPVPTITLTDRGFLHVRA